MNGIDYDSIYKAIRKAISVTGLKPDFIRKGFLNAPSNKQPFASYQISRISNRARDSRFFKNNAVIDLDEARIGFRYVDVEINFFGANALDMASQVIHALQSSDMTEYLYSLNVGYVDCSDVINNTALEMGAWEERGTITPTFYVPSVFDSTAKEIATEDIGFQILSGDKNYKGNIHIEKKQ